MPTTSPDLGHKVGGSDLATRSHRIDLVGSARAIHLVWVARGKELTYARDAGVGWGPAQTLGEATWSWEGPGPAILRTGSALVVVTPPPDARTYVSRDDGRAWESGAPPPLPPDRPYAVAASAEALFAVGEDETGALTCWTAPPDASEWARSGAAQTAVGATAVAVAVTDGRLVAAWTALGPSRAGGVPPLHVYAASSRDGGATWDPVHDVTPEFSGRATAYRGLLGMSGLKAESSAHGVELFFSVQHEVVHVPLDASGAARGPHTLLVGTEAGEPSGGGAFDVASAGDRLVVVWRDFRHRRSTPWSDLVTDGIWPRPLPTDALYARDLVPRPDGAAPGPVRLLPRSADALTMELRAAVTAPEGTDLTAVWAGLPHVDGYLPPDDAPAAIYSITTPLP